MPHVLLVNITGPSGEQLPTGALVPEGWDGEYVADLVRTGGAKRATKADLARLKKGSN